MDKLYVVKNEIKGSFLKVPNALKNLSCQRLQSQKTQNFPMFFFSRGSRKICRLGFGHSLELRKVEGENQRKRGF